MAIGAPAFLDADAGGELAGAQMPGGLCGRPRRGSSPARLRDREEAQAPE